MKKNTESTEPGQLYTCARCHKPTETLYQDFLCRDCAMEILNAKKKIINDTHPLSARNEPVSMDIPLSS